MGRAQWAWRLVGMLREEEVTVVQGLKVQNTTHKATYFLKPLIVQHYKKRALEKAEQILEK